MSRKLSSESRRHQLSGDRDEDRADRANRRGERGRRDEERGAAKRDYREAHREERDARDEGDPRERKDRSAFNVEVKNRSVAEREARKGYHKSAFGKNLYDHVPRDEVGTPGQVADERDGPMPKPDRGKAQSLGDTGVRRIDKVSAEDTR